MPERPDLLAAWREAAQQLRNVAGRAGQGVPELLSPLQRQAEVVEQLLRRQLELEQELARRAFAPAAATASALEKTPDALRAQAAAFRAAAASFTQAADLMELQASAVEQAIGALRTPLGVAEWGLGRLRGGSQSEPPND